MTAGNSITLWHFEECGTRIIRTVFSDAHIHIRQAFAKSGIKEKGFHPSSTAVVRIPTSDWIEVSPGDYVASGEHCCDEPDYLNAFKITAVSDNRRGSTPHWKFFCGGQR